VLTRLLGIDLPLVQAPMAGGLGSLPCAMLDGDALRRELAAIRAQTDRPFNVKPENLN
jgi:nitronate monooxygenase